jgi:thiamine biosynthesis lipoprotein
MGTVASEPVRRTWVEQIMGMPISVLARGPAARSAAADAAVRAVYAELTGVDQLLSPYRSDSEVSRLGRGELTLADSSPDVREVARRCTWAAELTGGLFDPVRPDGSWDPSGLVKGWAVERAGRQLATVTGTDWCLNAGGDVLVVAPSGEPFVIGIQDPRDAARVAAAVPLASGAVATSGTAARGAHLYDPRTGSAATARWLSVSVTGPSLETADVLATAAFVAAEGWADLVAGLDAYEGLAIASDGAQRATHGWPRGAPGADPAPR